jgi:hypothetical protein
MFVPLIIPTFLCLKKKMKNCIYLFFISFEKKKKKQNTLVLLHLLS